jgi:hypothetical protein
MRRIPVPTEKAHIRAILTPQELRDLERLAFDARMSVTSLVRVLTVAAAVSPQHKQWEKIADSLISQAASEPGKKRPGRPKK